ncbi:acriflavin resistance plasma membrane protein, partial [mine drainage metagenome]
LKALHISGSTWAAAAGSSFAGGAQASQLQVLVQSANAAQLQSASQKVTAIIERQRGVTQVQNDLSTREPLVSVQIDPVKAAAYGLTPGQIMGELSPYLTNNQITSIPQGGTRLPVYLRVGREGPQGIAAIRSVAISSALGSVPLSSLATVRLTTTPASITRTNGNSTATVSGVITSANVGAVSAAVQKAISNAHLPSDVTISMSGVTQMQGQAFSQMGEAMLAAIFLVYLVMLLAFGEGRSPFAIMFSLPLAVIGALGGSSSRATS